MGTLGLAIAVLHTLRILGAEQGPQAEVWYKVVAGIIAIPAGLLGLLLSYNILRKTTLEARKLELELQSKEAAPPPGPIRTSTEVAALPTTQLQRAVLLIVRFVVLELTLRLWNVVPAVVGYVTAAVLYALLLLRSEAGGYQYTLAVSALPQVIRLGFDVVYWLMVFGFGWPLLKDTCALLGIQVDSLSTCLAFGAGPALVIVAPRRAAPSHVTFPCAERHMLHANAFPQ